MIAFVIASISERAISVIKETQKPLVTTFKSAELFSISCLQTVVLNIPCCLIKIGSNSKNSEIISGKRLKDVTPTIYQKIMTINNSQQMTNHGWIQDPNGGQPPGFFYSQAARPHLHVTSSFLIGSQNMDPPWNLAYLAYTDANGAETVIYQEAVQGGNPGVDNPNGINAIPANYQGEARWAYETLK